MGLVNITGGSWPKKASRRMPPPQAAMTPTMTTPNRSRFFFTPTSTPERAKATVPMSSSASTYFSMGFCRCSLREFVFA